MNRNFGGKWTVRKLDTVENYLKAYLRALKKQDFSLGYIDAFAGSGSILLATSQVLEEENTSEVQGLIMGSAWRSLALDPGFDGYVFIEKDQRAADKLQELKKRFPDKNILVITGDANKRLRDICYSTDWRNRRAVIFLDPAGMQVEWKTMEAIASTESIDTWIWFPLGVGVNRLLTRSGDIPEAWQQRLDRIFGTPTWREAFYEKREEQTLFGIEDKTAKIASPESIAAFYNERLKEVFPAVSPRPAIMRNSRKNPIYLLCFASSNPGKGGNIAVGIANHLLKHA